MPDETAPSSLPGSAQRVLLLPLTSRDALAMQKLLTAAGFECATCPNMRSLVEMLPAGAGAIVVAEELLSADPYALAAHVSQQPVWSDLSIIVLSRAGTESPTLGPLLTRFGNVSVLERPIRTTTLVTIVRSALRGLERQYEVRKHLSDLADAGQVIRAGEERYRLLIDNITDYAIFLMDTTGCVTSWSRGSEQIFGYTAAEVLGQSAALFFAPEDRAAGLPEQEIRRAMTTGVASDSRWQVRKNGEPFFVECVMTATRDEAGNLIGLSMLMRDITERKQIEVERDRLFEAERIAHAEAERAGRMKDEFLSTLSHELRTPLNAILGWSHILMANPGEIEDVKEGIGIIERNARAQTQIIEDLLDMSRIISGKVRLEMKRLSLASVMEAAIETVRPAADAKEMTIISELDGSATPISGDATRMQQVFWNLLSNAVKFTPRGGRIQLRLACVDTHMVASVTDSGQGIDHAFLPHVFDRFWQADATTTRRHGGLGLGLAIVKQLIELHGGTIRADSPGPNLGTTFTVMLPLTAIHPEAPRPLNQQDRSESRSHVFSSSSRASIAGVKILIVDDEPDARSMLKRFLEDCRANVTTAASANEAMDRLSVEQPDVLISDIGMPGEDGYSLIRRVRSLPPDRGGAVPAIALTAYAREEDRANALRAGFQHHVAKPVDPTELVSLIASLVGNRFNDQDASSGSSSAGVKSETRSGLSGTSGSGTGIAESKTRV